MIAAPQPASADDRASVWQTLAVSSAGLAGVVVLEAILTVAAPPCRYSWMALAVPLWAAPIAFAHLDPGRAYRRSADRRLWLLCGLCAGTAALAYLVHPDPSAAIVPASLAPHLAVIAVLYRRKLRAGRRGL